jgi:hypothetical protein
MNVFQSMINRVIGSPKTSIAGLLICGVTVTGILSQQGISLGKAGTGTVVSLIGALAAGLLGLLAHDNNGLLNGDSGSSNQSATKLGAIMLCVLAISAMMPVTGCTQAQKISVAQEIVNWTPVFVSTADTVNSAIESLDPGTVFILGPLTLAINAFGPQLQQAAQNYLNNPTETTLQVLQSLVTQIQQSVNATLLTAAKITNPTSHATATKQINLLATIANTILALVQGLSSKAQVAAMASHAPIKLAVVKALLDQHAMQLAAEHVSKDLGYEAVPEVDEFFAYEARAGF